MENRRGCLAHIFLINFALEIQRVPRADGLKFDSLITDIQMWMHLALSNQGTAQYIMINKRT